MDFGLAGPGILPQEQQQPQQQSLLDMLNSAGGNAASLIAPPPEGWQSNAAAYDQAGLGHGWIRNNEYENPAAMARTQAGPQMPHGINPFTDIVFGGASGQEGQTSGFTLGKHASDFSGPDLFGGRQFQQGSFTENIPRELQPWLAPALMRYYYNNDYVNQRGSGGQNATWSGQYAPTAPNFGRYPYEGAWPGVAKYDPWGRQVGAQALYS